VAKMKWREDRLTGDWIQFWAFYMESKCAFLFLTISAFSTVVAMKASAIGN
jgi:hypothetical protein